MRKTPHWGRQFPVDRGQETPYRGSQPPVSPEQETLFRPHSRLRRRRRYAGREAKEYAFATVTFSHAAAYALLRFSILTLILRLARTIVAITFSSASTYVGATQADLIASRFRASFR